MNHEETSWRLGVCVSTLSPVLRVGLLSLVAGLVLTLGSAVSWEAWAGGEIYGTRMAGWPWRWLQAGIDMHPLSLAQRQEWLRSFVYLNEQTGWSLRWPQLAADWAVWTAAILVVISLWIVARRGK